jgi:hypothetical protein
MIKKSILALSITISMIACSGKKTDPAPVTTGTSASVCYLVSSSTGGTKDFDEMYDNSNRLDSMIVYSSTASNNGFKLKYNSNNKIIKAKLYYAGINTAYYNYHYNTNGQRDKDTLYVFDTSIPPTNPATYVADSVTIYTYNASNQITRLDNYNVNPNGTPSHTYSTFIYNAAGDLTQESDYNGSGTLLSTTDNTYDTKNSNFNNFTFISLVYAGQVHNILSQVVKTSGTSVDQSNSYTAAFTYNSNGYPLTEIDSYQDGSTDNSSYTYTCK